MLNRERNLVKIISEVCHEENIAYDSFSYNWIFRLKKGNIIRHIFGYKFELNSATSDSICEDKCATSEILSCSNISHVEHLFFMSPSNIKYVGVDGNWIRLAQYLDRNKKLVCKSNEGSGGGAVYLVSNQFELEQATHKIFHSSRAMAVSKYVEAPYEYRVIILNQEVKLIYSKNREYIVGDGIHTIQDLLIDYINRNKVFGFDINEDFENKILAAGEIFLLNWKHNLGQGAIPIIIRDHSKADKLSDLAKKTAEALKINFASVDIIEDEMGVLQVLEVNSGVMMEYFSQVSNENYLLTKSIYGEAIRLMFK